MNKLNFRLLDFINKMIETIDPFLICVNLVEQMLSVFPESIKRGLRFSAKYQPSVFFRKKIVTPRVDKVLKYNAVSVRKISHITASVACF